MRDLFAPKVNGHSYLKPLDDPFRYICGVFSGDSAVQIIQRANQIPLATYFPIRFNGKGEPIPLWRNYLMIEFREGITINLCRTTSHFIRVVSERDKDGLVTPVMVRKDSVTESLRLVTMGKFNDKSFKRQFHGKGSIVRVLEGNFIDRRVTLEIDVPPDMNGRTRIPVDMNGIKCKIELFKLAL
jgi:hypothetical protein